MGRVTEAKIKGVKIPLLSTSRYQQLHDDHICPSLRLLSVTAQHKLILVEDIY